MELFFREEGEGEILLILHGLFGSSDNWMTLAKKYAQDFRVIVPDLRNHGLSPHSEVFSYDAMTDDLMELMQSLSPDSINILGHSMGGKAAMRFTSRFQDRVKKLIVADISPKEYPVHHQRIIRSLKSLNLTTIRSRGDADKLLAHQIENFGERQFLLKNLKRDENGFRWKMALNYIADKIEAVGEKLQSIEAIKIPTLFIRGGGSWYINDNELDLIDNHFSNYQLKTIEGAGHWLHAEKPQEFYDLSIEFLKN